MYKGRVILGPNCNLIPKVLQQVMIVHWEVILAFSIHFIE